MLSLHSGADGVVAPPSRRGGCTPVYRHCKCSIEGTLCRTKLHIHSITRNSRNAVKNCAARRLLLKPFFGLSFKSGSCSARGFRRQQSIGPYVVDFYCRECRVIVELDGQRHYQPLAEEYESERTRYLEQEFGMKIVRFENKVLYENPEAVLETIKEALRERGAT